MRRIAKRPSPDSRSIDIEDEYAVIFWTKELHVTATKLKEAVLDVGVIVADVKRRLK